MFRSKRYSGFDPRTLGNCALWLDAADTTTLFSDTAGTAVIASNGQTIRCWKDKSGRGCNATQSGSAPVWNSQNLISFTAVNQTTGQSMVLPVGTLPFASGTNAYSIFAIANTRTTSGVKTIIGSGTAASNSFNVLQLRDSYITNLWYFSDISGGTLQSNTLFLANIAFDGSTRNIYQNASTVNTTASSGWTAPNSNNVIGVEPATGNWYYDGNMGEILVFSNALTTAQRQQVEGYLAWKWGISSSFQPTSISGLSLWLDAADSTTLTLSGSNVTQWRDKSGNGRDVSQNTVSFQPTYSNTRVNFVSTSSQRLETTTPIGITSTFTLFGVGLHTNSATNGRIFEIRGTPNIVGGMDFGSRIVFAGNSTDTRFANSIGTSTAQSIGTVIRAASSAQYAFNGATLSTMGNPGTAAISPNRTVVGCACDPGTDGTGATYTAFLNGYVNEVIVYNSNLSDSDRQQVEDYLSRKWNVTLSRTILNLPSSHPFRLAPPVLRPFNPTDIANCALWLDAADAKTITLSGSNVTAWTDKSGSGYNCTVTSGASSPTYSSNAVLFRSSGGGTTGQSLDISAGLGTYLSNRDFTVLCVGTRTTSAFTAFFCGTATANLQNIFLGYANSSQAMNAVYGGSELYATVSAFSVGESARVLAFSLISGTSGISVNGTLTTSAVGTRLTALPGPQLGRRYTGASATYHDYNLNEIVMFGSNLSTTQRQQVESYLATKWGLQGSTPSTHPARIAPALTVQFQPTLLSNCALWLDAADAKTLTLSGSNVTAWADKSGNGRNASATGTVTRTSRGGMSMNLSNYFTGSLTNSGTTLTAFIVADLDSTTASQGRLLSFGQSGTNDFDGLTRVIPFYRVTTTAVVQSYRNGTSLGAFTISYNTPFIGSTLFDGTNNTIYGNGSVGTSVATSGSFGYTIYAIGEGAGNAQSRIVGTVYEVIAFNSALSTAERQQVEGYLATKWGLQGSLPSTHPYKLTALL